MPLGKSSSSCLKKVAAPANEQRASGAAKAANATHTHDHDNEHQQRPVISDAEYCSLLVVRHRATHTHLEAADALENSLNALCAADGDLRFELDGLRPPRFRPADERNETRVLTLLHHRDEEAEEEGLLDHNAAIAEDMQVFRDMRALLDRLRRRITAVRTHHARAVICVERGDEQLDFAVHNLHIPKARFGSFLLKHPDWHPDTHCHETGRRLHAPHHLPNAPERFTPAGSWILHPASRGIERSPFPSSSSSDEKDDADNNANDNSANDARDARRAAPPTQKKKRRAHTATTATNARPRQLEKEQREKKKRPRHDDDADHDEQKHRRRSPAPYPRRGASTDDDAPTMVMRFVPYDDYPSGDRRYRYEPCRLSDLNAASASSSDSDC
jgi:hypothetical protein